MLDFRKITSRVATTATTAAQGNRGLASIIDLLDTSSALESMGSGIKPYIV